MSKNWAIINKEGINDCNQTKEFSLIKHKIAKSIIYEQFKGVSSSDNIETEINKIHNTLFTTITSNKDDKIRITIFMAH